jgi:O-acetyl-ADP-ribose deacetylase (regulator of RNase III)
MPIIFISLSEKFTENIIINGYEAFTMKIQDYIPDPTRKTYFVSPANSLCFMDGGFDLALSTIIFPNIEKKVKQIVKNLNITNLLGRNYLPIGSSIIIDESFNKSLIVAPTMLLPQNISSTYNAYYCTMAVLNNILINRNEDISNIDIIFTSLCCGYGKMDELTSISQILKGIDDYKSYKPIIMNKNIIINEPNLFEQPKIYQNTEWFSIDNNKIVQVQN